MRNVLNSVIFSSKPHSLQTNNHWNEQLIATNTILGECRENYFNLLNKEFRQIIDDLKREIPEIYDDISSLTLDYYKGWHEQDFEETLKINANKDARTGFTNSGTHRSDFYV